jgi:tetratricopeptide (TPR) repeat protein
MTLFLLLLLLAPPSPDLFQQRVQAGIDALRRGDLAAAQQDLEQASRQAPKQAEVWLLLAQTYAGQKKGPQALDAARKAESLAGDSVRVLQGLATFYGSTMQDLEKAAALGKRYAELNADDTTAWRRVAALYLEIGKPDAAIDAGTRGLKVDASADVHTILGQAYAAKREWAPAAVELKEALKLSPYDEGAYFRLAQLYLVQQEFDAAIEVLSGARKTFDKSPQLELALGVAYYGARRFPEAVDQFLLVIVLDPDMPQPYLFLGRMLEHVGERMPELLLRSEQLEKNQPKSYLGYQLHAKAIAAQLPAGEFTPEAAAALALFEKALALQPENAETNYEIGCLLDRKGDYAGAAARLEKAIQLNPKSPTPHYRLSRVYDRMGRKEDAAAQRALHEKLSEEESKQSPPAQPAAPLK